MFSKVLYQTVKVTLATVIAIAAAAFLDLQYGTTAGVIALLSVLDTRKQSAVTGVKRLISGTLGIGLGIVLFNIFGHHLWVLAVFLLLYMPGLVWFKASEALAVGTVLVTHIYAINTTESFVFFNELGLLVIGIAVGWVMNLHVINEETEINQLQHEAEEMIKLVLHKMKFQLLNQCSVDEQVNTLEALDQVIKTGLKKAITYNNNYIFRDYGYYEAYFRMRREQYFILLAMERHFREMFVAVEEAQMLSEFTEILAEELNESNDGMALLARLTDLRADYRQRPLPQTREAFEHRATLFQYMKDLEYFVGLKSAFMVKHGDIHYM